MSRLPTDVRRTGADLRLAVLAAAAMVATLPGRTHGLGLVTEPLMADLGIERLAFATLNLWATLVGGLFCVPVGWLVDRLGTRITLAAVLASLGGTVLLMARLARHSAELTLPSPEALIGAAESSFRVPVLLFLLVLLSRGLGQSGLSVVSLGIVGKAAGERPGWLIGGYSCLVAIGFMAAFTAVKITFEQGAADWREVWTAIGWILLGFAAVSPLLGRSAVACSLATTAAPAATETTLSQAMATPACWVFGLATSFYGLVASGLSLFNQSLLTERGFNRDVFLTITSLAPLVGLVANLGGGWLASRLPLGRIAAAGLALQACALGVFPSVGTLTGIYLYAAAMAFAGGLLTVVFFSVWRQAFGVSHLGAIQGAAQLLTVVASAAGPVVLAVGQRATGSYAPVVMQLGAVSAVFAVAALVVPMPRSASSFERNAS